MDTRTIQKPLAQFYKNLVHQIKIKDMIVFGSWVEGKPKKSSDIDIVVISDDFAKIREDKRLQILDKAAEEIKPEIQAWGFTSREVGEADELTTLGHARTVGLHWSALRDSTALILNQKIRKAIKQGEKEYANRKGLVVLADIA